MQLNRPIVLLVLAISGSALAIQEKQTEIPANTIYKSCAASLFEQDSVTEPAAYKGATAEEREQMLEDNFTWKRRVCYAKELASLSVTLVPAGAGLYYTYRYAYPNNAANVGLGIGGAFVGMTLFGRVLENISRFVFEKFERAQNLGSNILFPAGNDVLAKYEKQYVRQKPSIAPQLQNILEENFINARTEPFESNSMYSNGYSGSPQKKSAIDFARNVLALPAEKVEVTYDPARLEQHLATYDPKILGQFKRFAVRHAAASTGETVKKIVAYYEGPPGVGKTRAAENIAEALGVPFYVIKMAGKGVKELEGDANTPGLLLEAMLQAKINGRGAKNMIIFFDEIDRALELTPALLPFLLTLLEPGQKTFYSPYLGIDVDISSIGFILAGNFDITDKALRNRFEVVKFEGYKSDFKRKVVKESIFAQLLATYKDSRQPLYETDFNAADWKVIDGAIEADQDVGFREIIKFLQNFMDDKALCKFYGECPEPEKTES